MFATVNVNLKVIDKFPRSSKCFPYCSWPTCPNFPSVVNHALMTIWGNTQLLLSVNCRELWQLRPPQCFSKKHDFYSETNNTLSWLAEQLLDKWPGNGHAGDQIITLRRKSSYPRLFIFLLNVATHLLSSPSSQVVSFRMSGSESN